MADEWISAECDALAPFLDSQARKRAAAVVRDAQKWQRFVDKAFMLEKFNHALAVTRIPREAADALGARLRALDAPERVFVVSDNGSHESGERLLDDVVEDLRWPGAGGTLVVCRRGALALFQRESGERLLLSDETSAHRALSSSHRPPPPRAVPGR